MSASHYAEQNAQNRVNIAPGTHVQIVQKHHQTSGQLTQGVVECVLTNASKHPRGIKVRLSSGVVGRVHVVDAIATVTQKHTSDTSITAVKHTSSRHQHTFNRIMHHRYYSAISLIVLGALSIPSLIWDSFHVISLIGLIP